MQQTNKYVEIHKTFVKKVPQLLSKNDIYMKKTLPSLVVPNFPTNTDLKPKYVTNIIFDKKVLEFPRFLLNENISDK